MVRVPSDIRLNAFFGGFFFATSCDLQMRTITRAGMAYRVRIGVIRAGEGDLEGKNEHRRTRWAKE